jgi:hypothetical protein
VREEGREGCGGVRRGPREAVRARGTRLGASEARRRGRTHSRPVAAFAPTQPPPRGPHTHLQRGRQVLGVHRIGVLVRQRRLVDLEVPDAVARRAGAHDGAGAGRVRVAHAAARAGLGAWKGGWRVARGVCGLSGCAAGWGACRWLCKGGGLLGGSTWEGRQGQKGRAGRRECCWHLVVQPRTGGAAHVASTAGRCGPRFEGSVQSRARGRASSSPDTDGRGCVLARVLGGGKGCAQRLPAPT